MGTRLLAIVYDILIVFFISIVLTFIVQQIIIQSALVPLEQIQISAKESIPMIPTNSITSYVLKSFWPLIAYFYFAYYWTKRGQTPGMKVWKVKVVNQQGQLISWSQSLIRTITALFGLGLFVMPFNTQRLALQDIVSKTYLMIHE